MIDVKISQFKYQWILLFLALFVFVLVIRSPISHTGSDPRASLLLSQVLIENQSIKLDKYKDSNYGYVIHKKNNHYYYYFPLGTSVSSIPFVWFETSILNHNMNNKIHDAHAQKFIAGVISVIIFLLLYLIAKMYLSEKLSIIISLSFWLGTSLSSTLGQALWSQCFASLYALFSIFLMLKITKENKENYWFLLGLSLFMAYLTRPTMSLLSITVILFLFFNNKKYIAIKTASVVGVFLGTFIFLSLNEFNQLLPDYYLPKRLSSETFWIALYGNLFSPARGLLIFSPFLFLFLLNYKGTYRIFKNDKTLIIMVCWIIVHLIIISKFPHWWAGHSYGARFMNDILPAVFLLFVILISSVYKDKSSINRRVLSFFLIIAIPISVYFNAIQGLYNPYSGIIWNSNPNIDQYPEYLFDWKYPQFLHNKRRHYDRLTDFNIRNSKVINFNSKSVVFEGWSYPESTSRWSLDHSSSIKFKIKSIDKIKGLITFDIGTLGKQEIKLKINEHYIGSQTVNSRNINLIFRVNPSILRTDIINTIEFKFPNAHKPDNGDQRVLAMALKSFLIE